MNPTDYTIENDTAYYADLPDCEMINPIIPTNFYSFPSGQSVSYPNWPIAPGWRKLVNLSATVDGFFGGCYPLDGLLGSTLECLYDIKCLQLLKDYFPSLNQVCFIKSLRKDMYLLIDLDAIEFV